MPKTLYLAPLHGVTNRVFRKTYFTHFQGFDAALAPFILAVNTAQQKQNHFKDLIPRESGSVDIEPQLLGNDSAAFVATAKILADAGYSSVNWNLGCPYPMVAGKMRGSGLLPYPERIERFLDETCGRVSIPISVKLRLGRKDPGEIVALMPVLNRFPLERIIIHPRVGIQMYKGSVDLEGFAQAADLCRLPVIYNGDIRNVETFRTLECRFPDISGWMIGRGALYDPFLPARISGMSNTEKSVEGHLKILRSFHDDLYESYRSVLCGPAHVLDKMKEVWTYIGHSFHGSERELEAIAHAKSLERYERAVSALIP